MQIELERAYDKAIDNDTYRVLVDRLWPRGVKKEDLRLDEWCKEIAPSAELREWYGHEADKFKGFRKRYITELDDSNEAASLLKRVHESGRQKLVLVFGAKVPELSQAAVLKEYLDEIRGRNELAARAKIDV